VNILPWRLASHHPWILMHKYHRFGFKETDATNVHISSHDDIL